MMIITRGFGTEQGGVGPGGTLTLVDGVGVSIDDRSINTKMLSDSMNIGLDKELYNINIIKDQSIETTLDSSTMGVSLNQQPIGIKLSGGSIIVPEGDIMRKICAEDVGGHRLVTIDPNGHILHADSDLILDGKQVVGLTLQASLAGTECEIAITGDEVIEPSWSFNTTSPIFLGDDGLMTQIAPTEGFVLIVAVPLTSTSIRVRIEMPIFL